MKEGNAHVSQNSQCHSHSPGRNRRPVVSPDGDGVTNDPNNTKETVIGALLAAAAVAICALIDHFTKEEDP